VTERLFEILDALGQTGLADMQQLGRTRKIQLACEHHERLDLRGRQACADVRSQRPGGSMTLRYGAIGAGIAITHRHRAIHLFDWRVSTAPDSLLTSIPALARRCAGAGIVGNAVTRHRRSIVALQGLRALMVIACAACGIASGRADVPMLSRHASFEGDLGMRTWTGSAEPSPARCCARRRAPAAAMTRRLPFTPISPAAPPKRCSSTGSSLPGLEGSACRRAQRGAR